MIVKDSPMPLQTAEKPKTTIVEIENAASSCLSDSPFLLIDNEKAMTTRNQVLDFNRTMRNINQLPEGLHK